MHVTRTGVAFLDESSSRRISWTFLVPYKKTTHFQYHKTLLPCFAKSTDLHFSKKNGVRGSFVLSRHEWIISTRKISWKRPWYRESVMHEAPKSHNFHFLISVFWQKAVISHMEGDDHEISVLGKKSKYAKVKHWTLLSRRSGTLDIKTIDSPWYQLISIKPRDLCAKYSIAKKRPLKTFKVDFLETRKCGDGSAFCKAGQRSNGGSLWSFEGIMYLFSESAFSVRFQAPT